MTLISPGDCTLQSGKWLWDDMPLNSPSGSTLQRDTYLWNHDIEFAMWEHPAMLQVAVGWHAIEFAQTSAILEFYIWFRFRAHHRSRHVILHQSAKFYPNRTILGRKKWRNVDFKDGGSQPSWILGIQWVMDNGFFEKANYITPYRSSIDTIALNCLVFEKIAFFAFRRQTTNKQTDEQMDSTDALSRRSPA